MGFEAEALGGHLLEVAAAAVDFVDFAAGAAVEVVVVGFGGEFVEGGAAGDFDGGEPLGFDEGLDRAVDGGDADAGGVGLGEVADFLGAEGAAGLADGALDGLTLSGFSLHGRPNNDRSFSIALAKAARADLHRARTGRQPL